MDKSNKSLKMVDANADGLIDVFTAKKDYTIFRNQDFFEIKKGQKVVGVPTIYLQNLKTEGVI